MTKINLDMSKIEIEKRIKFLNGIKKEYDSKKIHNLISKYNMNYNK